MIMPIAASIASSIFEHKASYLSMPSKLSQFNITDQTNLQCFFLRRDTSVFSKYYIISIGSLIGIQKCLSRTIDFIGNGFSPHFSLNIDFTRLISSSLIFSLTFGSYGSWIMLYDYGILPCSYMHRFRTRADVYRCRYVLISKQHWMIFKSPYLVNRPSLIDGCAIMICFWKRCHITKIQSIQMLIIRPNLPW